MSEFTDIEVWFNDYNFIPWRICESNTCESNDQQLTNAYETMLKI